MLDRLGWRDARWWFAFGSVSRGALDAALFKANGRLRRIFASPINVSKDIAAMMLFAVPYVVSERRPPARHVLWAQIGAIAGTGRQLRQWLRTADKGNADSSVFDVLADCVRRPIAIAQNGASRSPIPAHADRTKRRIAITDSGACRSDKTAHRDQLTR